MLIYMDPNNQLPGTPAQPDQPLLPPTPAAPPHDPYGFIMDTQHQPKRKLQVNSNSLKTRLLMVVGIGMFVVIAAIVVMSILTGQKEKSAVLLTSLAAEQQEIARIADLGLKDAKDPSVKAYAGITKLSIITQQTKLITYLGSKNVKIIPATLISKQDKSTDSEFTAAKANNQFDEVLTATLKKSLTAYASSLKTSYQSASNPTSKKLLTDSYTSTDYLLK